MEDELSLPPLSRDNASSTLAKTNLSRKRVRDTPPDSSDPPMFSSDDDPSIEKYSQKRRKQKFRGPWFDQHPASDSPFEEDEPSDRKMPIRSKRTLNKKVDSGVFMGSDGTDVEDINLEQGKKAWAVNNLSVPSPLKPRIILEPPRDIHAQKKIERCLEYGEEYIDLSRLALVHIENSTIRPLGSLVRAARGYRNLEPSLRIILSGNQLTNLPAELFNLERLIFLSLRDNRLRAIPSGIGRLMILENLNVSQNKLGYLPYEVLDLVVGGALYDFQLHPNPFYQPMAIPDVVENLAAHFEIELNRRWPPLDSPPRLSPKDTIRFARGSVEVPRPQAPATPMSPIQLPPYIQLGSAGPSSGEKCSLTYKFRTEVRFLSLSGNCIKGPTFPSDSHWKGAGKHVKLPLARTDDIPKPPAVQSRVQSLLEKALQSCSRNPELPHLESYLKYPPPQIPSLLRRAESVNYSGPTLCTMCRRSFVIPQTEWIEWWEIEKISKKDRMVSGSTTLATLYGTEENERDATEKLIPFIRRGCSWSCLPQEFEHMPRTEEEES